MTELEAWRIEALDRDDKPTGPLLGVTGGSLDWSVSKQIHGGGSLNLEAEPAGIDWVATRLRITHLRGDLATPMGVWVPAVPERKITPSRTTATVQLLDKTSLLDIEVPYMSQVEAGVVVTDRVAEICRRLGVPQLALTPSSKTLRETITWDAGVTWLKVINDILAAIGHGSIWADGLGWLRAEPYQAPADRPLAGVFGPRDSDLRVLPEWTDSLDISAIPNRIVVWTTGSLTQKALRGDAELPADHPLGHRRRGDRPRAITGVEAADQQVASQIAARELATATTLTRRVTCTHPVDETNLRDRVQLRTLGMDGVIVERKVRLDIGPVVEDVVRAHHSRGGEGLWI